MKSLTRLYHALPPSAKNLAATLHGYQLRRWRYGPETERLVAEALERERWPAERLRAWQQERLARLLHLAVNRVPHYRDLWAERRRRGDRRSWEELENWPVLRRETVRAAPERFLVDPPRPALRLLRTSGSSGTTVFTWRSRAVERQWFALCEARWRRWYGVSLEDRWGIMGGQLVVPTQRRRPPFWVWNGGLRQLYMSVYHNAPGFAPHFAAALRRQRVRYLYGYPSAMAYLARAILEQELEPPGLAVVVSNAEQLFPDQREVLERAFRCPVRNTYGMVEAVTAAGECEHGALHLWPEAGILEVLDDADAPLPAGEPGRFVCTGLVNDVMPLLRYEVGDHGALAPERPCRCGRAFPAIGEIDGRLSEALYAPDGRVLYRMGGIRKRGVPLRDSQYVQEDLHTIRYLYIPGEGFTDEHVRIIVEQIRARLGDVKVILERVESIPRGPRGKRVRVVSHLDRPPTPLAR